MRVLESRNVNEAYIKGLNMLTLEGVEEDSRAGPVLVQPTPVVNVYAKPRERVLFDPARDANPFFHAVEAVWMIAGRRDATLLDRFVSDFSARFAETNGEAHGAYGYRWRKHFCHPAYTGDENNNGAPYYLDQLTECGRLLRLNPLSRQVVMAMWDPSEDLGVIKADIPCNDLVMFRTVEKNGRRELDMSIMARSHDAVWGAYGANFVHMTVMHEVVAGLANLQVGTYRHFSNNFHVYKSVLPKIGDFTKGYDLYKTGEVFADRICDGQKDTEDFILECQQLCIDLENATVHRTDFQEPSNPWLRDTVLPMIWAHAAFKDKAYEDALGYARDIIASDWRFATLSWLERRIAKKQPGPGAAV